MNPSQIDVEAMDARKIALARSRRTTLIGIVVSLVLALIKGAAGVFGNSYALIADAIESASDVFTSTAVLIGLSIAARPADSNHPYGHGKAEPLAALVVCLALLGAAAVIAINSVHEMVRPHHAPAPFTLIVLVLVIVVKETLFRTILRVGDDLNSVVVKTDAWHHRSDALTSAAAFIGISIALLGGPGFEPADDWAALLASMIIVVNAAMLGKSAIEELTDATPGDATESRLRDVALQVPGVIDLHHSRVRKLGFDYFVDLDVIVAGDIPVRDGHRIAHAVHDRIRHELPMVRRVLVHIEPHDSDRHGHPRNLDATIEERRQRGASLPPYA